MVALLRDRGVENVALVGGSIGDMASIDAATDIEPPVAAVVSLSGASSDTVTAAAVLEVPLLQIVAEDDTSFAVPARATDDAAEREAVTTVRYQMHEVRSVGVDSVDGEWTLATQRDLTHVAHPV